MWVSASYFASGSTRTQWRGRLYSICYSLPIESTMMKLEETSYGAILQWRSRLESFWWHNYMVTVAGVPQGSVLGHVQFLAYTDDTSHVQRLFPLICRWYATVWSLPFVWHGCTHYTIDSMHQISGPVSCCTSSTTVEHVENGSILLWHTFLVGKSTVRSLSVFLSFRAVTLFGILAFYLIVSFPWNSRSCNKVASSCFSSYDGCANSGVTWIKTSWCDWWMVMSLTSRIPPRLL